MSAFQLQRLGLVMEPEPGNPMEAEGVLNPASAWRGWTCHEATVVKAGDGKITLTITG